MGGQRTISGTQFVLMLVVSYLTAGLFTFPQRIVREAGAAGVYAILVTTLVALAGALLIVWVGSHFPGKTAVEWGDAIVPLRIHRVLAAGGAVFHLVMVPMQMRTFMEMLKETFFQVTPVSVLVSALVLVAAFGAYQGVEAIGRIAVFALPVMLLTVTIAYVFTFTSIEAYRLVPDFHTLPDFGRACYFASLLYEGAAVAMILQSKLEHPRRAVGYVFVSFAISTFLFLMIYLTTLGSFGQEGVSVLAWPAPQLLLSVRLPGWFTERLGLFVEIVWAGLMVLYAAVHLWATTLLMVQVLGLRQRPAYNWILPGLAGLYFLIAVAPGSVEEVEYVFGLLPLGSIYLNLGLPLIWLTVGLLRGRFRSTKGGRNGGQLSRV
ncbi:MAG TPA: GerAB/ArcD/ProY family transporter [Symbiobacteriaceae bacterium]|nr:GerAB/ArcD/ProY family transporter [Symbiobacteriaceae bacterium]